MSEQLAGPVDVPPITRQLNLGRRGDMFVVPAMATWRGRLYGGVLIGGAVRAAACTVDDDRPPHSVSVTFHRPGAGDSETLATVTRVHDGRSVSTRTVELSQGERLVATATVSFHVSALGRLQHEPAMPSVPAAADLPTTEELFAADPVNRDWVRWLWGIHGIDGRFPALPARVLATRGLPAPAHQSAWLRAGTPLPGGAVDHAAALGYVSDSLLLATALGPHDVVLQDERVQFATLSHTVWFHRQADLNEWFLYDMTSRWAGADRALCHGEVFDLHGHLVATTMQEGLLRLAD